MLQKTINAKKILVVLAVCLTVFRIGLFLRTPYFFYGSSPYDDEYFLRAADSLLSGKWLGEGYTYTTLIKGISFPLFIAAAKVLCMPYSLLLGLFYAVSAAIFAHALSRISDSILFLFISYTIVLYSPVGFSEAITFRLYRNALVFPAVIAVFACILEVFFHRKEKAKKQIFHMLLLGVVFTFFYYIREDSVWMIPIVVASLIASAVYFAVFSKLKAKVRTLRCISLFIPAAVFISISVLYCGLNYRYYGVFAVNDRSGGSFAVLTGNMMRVENEDGFDDQHWVTRDTLENIIDVCPSLEPYRSEILFQYDHWADESGNVKGDLFAWALREALNSCGIFGSASEMENFCSQANDELNLSALEGKISFDETIRFSTQSKGVYLSDIPGIISRTFVNLWNLSDFTPLKDYAETADIRKAESLTGVLIEYPSCGSLELSGWVLIKDGSSESKNIVLELSDKNNADISYEIKYEERKDVLNVYPEYASSGCVGFDISANDVEDADGLVLKVYSDGEPVGSLKPNDYFGERLMLHIDSFEYSDEDALSADSVRVSSVSRVLYRISDVVTAFLKVSAFIMLFAALLLFILRRTRKNLEPLLFIAGFVLTALLAEFGVTVFTRWLDETDVYFYSAGVIATMIAAGLLGLSYFFSRVKQQKTVGV